MNERPWVVASARRHATCVDAGHIAGVKLAKHVRPLQFVRRATRPNSCVSLARRVTSWFTPRLHRSHNSNVLASWNWTCEVVFRVQHGRDGAGESDKHGGKCAAICGEMTRAPKVQIGAIGESRNLWYQSSVRRMAQHLAQQYVVLPQRDQL